MIIHRRLFIARAATVARERELFVNESGTNNYTRKNQPQQSHDNNELLSIIANGKFEGATTSKPGKAHISVGTVPLNRLLLRSKIAVSKATRVNERKVFCLEVFWSNCSQTRMNHLHSFESRPISDGMLPVKLL